MKTRCYSVRLESLTSISDKCLKATGFDGSEALIPKSQYFGQDYDVTKSEAHWISAWILGKKDLQYSGKKEAWFDSETGCQLPTYTFTKHVPKKITKEVEPDKELKR
ncbi:hypothetical protein [Draconibacterium orientale]|uniref:hypothetical protein n=1 Tax=Draconibacterium orientale TaxID=1168034 RepID=UPI0029BFDACB|nr:hypothetical protein [Draconibacterium orientale]